MSAIDELLREDETWWPKLGYTQEEQQLLHQWKQQRSELEQAKQQAEQQVAGLEKQLEDMTAAMRAQVQQWTVQVAAAMHAVYQRRALLPAAGVPAAPLVAAVAQAEVQQKQTIQQVEQDHATCNAALALVQQELSAAKDVAATALQQMQAHLKKEVPHPFYCFDNPHVHHQAKLMLQGKLWEQPTYSPDFNKPVEHAIGIISSAVKREVSELSLHGERSTDMGLWQQRILAIFKDMSPEGLSKDVHSLPETWRAVAAEAPEGAAGGWPDKKLR